MQGTIARHLPKLSLLLCVVRNQRTAVSLDVCARCAKRKTDWFQAKCKRLFLRYMCMHTGLALPKCSPEQQCVWCIQLGMHTGGDNSDTKVMGNVWFDLD